jgi:subtilase-type serine protease
MIFSAAARRFGRFVRPTVDGPVAIRFLVTAATLSPLAAIATELSLPTLARVPVAYAQSSAGSVPRPRVDAIPGDVIGGELEVTPSAVAPASNTRVWGSGFAFSSRVGADINGAAIKSNGGGGSIGFDRTFGPTFLAGLALSLSRSETTSVGTSSESDTVSGALYAAWVPVPGLEFEGLLGLDRSETDSRRIVTFGGAAVPLQGDAESLGLSAVGNVGYRFRFASSAGETFFKPFAGLAYTTQDRDAYSEFGVSGLTMLFPAKTFDRSAFNLGAAAGIDFAAAPNWTIRPELRVAWSHYLTDPAPPVPAVLGGFPLVLRDPQPGRDGAVVAAEVTALTAGFQVFAGYSGEFRSNATAHQGRLGLRVTW